MLCLWPQSVNQAVDYLNVALNGTRDKELLVRIQRNALDGAIVCLRK